MSKESLTPRQRLAAALAWTLLLALLFAQVEIQIEGSAGWAANLPTWRIEEHWALDWFWGGRALTGYHASMFSFVALVFHFPVFFAPNWSLREESRVIGCLIVFWITEDFLWFVMNPAFGLSRFSPETIPWHKHWLGIAPVDYWIFSALAVALLLYSMKTPRASRPDTADEV